MSNPQSTIMILDVPLDNRYLHTFYFGSKAEQSAFFRSKVKTTFTGYTFIRKSWSLKVQAHMENAIGWKYLMFTNFANGKEYYYFINNVEYVNENTVELFLEIDVMQTYYFDYRLRHCFIERQHTESDEIGEHTIDEGIDVGELTSYHEYNMEDLRGMCVLMLTAVYPNATTEAEAVGEFGRMYNGVYSGLGVYATANKSVLNKTLSTLTNLGKVDGVVALWMYPKELVTLFDGSWDDSGMVEVEAIAYDNATLAPYTNYGSKIFGGYVPENNKLYCYPYNLLYASNNTGGSAVYRFEWFDGLSTDGNYSFGLFGALTPDAGVKLAPECYNCDSITNYEEGIELSAFPSCGWNADTYKIWLAQNQHTQQAGFDQAKIQAIAGAVGAVAYGSMLNVNGAVGGLATSYSALVQTQNLLAQRQDMAVQPAQARGQHSGNINVSAGRQTFTFYYKCVRKEFARIIDDYFNRYGYKINRIDLPNPHARSRYTYIKTVDCCLDGDLCADDLRRIASIYDSGITFWADRETIGFYGGNDVL